MTLARKDSKPPSPTGLSAMLNGNSPLSPDAAATTAAAPPAGALRKRREWYDIRSAVTLLASAPQSLFDCTASRANGLLAASPGPSCSSGGSTPTAADNNGLGPNIRWAPFCCAILLALFGVTLLMSDEPYPLRLPSFLVPTVHGKAAGAGGGAHQVVLQSGGGKAASGSGGGGADAGGSKGAGEGHDKGGAGASASETSGESAELGGEAAAALEAEAEAEGAAAAAQGSKGGSDSQGEQARLLMVTGHGGDSGAPSAKQLWRKLGWFS